VDIDPTLVDQARGRLAVLGYHPALTAADGLAGWPDRAPFDRIVGTCSTHRVPAAWLAQTRPGGIVVANVGYGVVPLHVAADGSASGRFIPEAVAFIEARPADAGPALPFADAVDLVYGPGDQAPAEVPDGIGDEEFWFWVNAAAPGLTWFELFDDEGDGTSRCLVDPVTRSWYRVLTTPAGHTTVTQAGPRRLFDELRTMHDRWTAAGRPAHDRLGLTVTADGRHTLWVDRPDGAASWHLD
jgi:Protein-L-isoaspartate(D-aspartate) O-methyltransferase (PCMT)